MPLGQKPGHLGAHVGDAQGEEHPGQGPLLAGINVARDLGGQLISHALQRQELLFLQIVQVGQVLDQPLANKDPTPLLPQAIDIHRPLADEVLEQLQELGWARGIGAAMHGFSRRFHHRAAAHRAVAGHLEHPLLTGASGHHRAHHLGDHIAGPLHHHPVADADVFAPDVLFVVQRCLPHRGAAHHHRLQHGVGVEAAGAPHINANVQQPGHRLLRRELEGHRPPGLPAHHPQGILVGEGGYLDHHPVHLVGQVAAPLQPGVVVIGNLLQGMAQPVMGVHPEAEGLQPLQSRPVVVRPRVISGIPQGVDPDLHVP